MIYTYNGEQVKRWQLLERLAEEYEGYDDDYEEYVKECKDNGEEPDELCEWAYKKAEESVKYDEEQHGSDMYTSQDWRVREE